MDHQPLENSSTKELTDVQQNFEKRFSCPICLDPKLKMVVSVCQHRICSDCLYDQDNKLHKAMQNCPSCKRQNAFPEDRPDIPEDAILIQRHLGVTECPLDGCKAGLWIWDVEKHIESCPYAVVSPKPGAKRGRKPTPKQAENASTSPVAKRQKQAPLPSTCSKSPSEEDAASTSRVTRSSSSAGQVQQPCRYPLRSTSQRQISKEQNYQYRSLDYSYQACDFGRHMQQHMTGVPLNQWNHFVHVAQRGDHMWQQYYYSY
ncbi:uncharacterized protein LOC110975223 [Acanthaster planci]|uniref:Uncharacterized protein LOC110975223 n=1 Tax=Acanthaster planci TaxID=133434 RepID=A0A8B7XTD8_ACAPL|nr:uncharacterized protein LOC110975223 [Acanthaster planci]